MEYIYQIASGNSFLWMNTFDYQRCVYAVADRVKETLGRNVFCWDVHRGVVDVIENKVVEEPNEIPTEPIDFLDDQEEPCIMMILDYHKFLDEVSIWRRLINKMEDYSSKGQAIIVVSGTMEIPIEINRYVTVVPFQLPTKEELLEKAMEIKEDFGLEGSNEQELERMAMSGVGLTLFEFENALALSYTKSKVLSQEFISKQREQMIKKSRSLSIHESKVGFEAVIGLDCLKDFCKKMVLSGNGRGVLILGIPGAGKSHFAKCLGKETNRPTLIMETGSMKGSLVGQTEEWTKAELGIIDAQPQCIVLIDEIEKALSGVNDTVNSTSVHQGGIILNWLNDKSSNSFVIATANDISKLPPEFLRAGRWDAIFYVDVPNEKESQQLLQFYCEQYDIPFEDVDISNWTGAEIETLTRLASNLNVSLEEAKEYVPSICEIGEDNITRLRQWAKGRTVPASTPSEETSVPSEKENAKKRKVEVL